MTDEELYQDCVRKFEIIETMIDDEFSRRSETAPLMEAIHRLYRRIQHLNTQLRPIYCNCTKPNSETYQLL